MWKLYVGLKSFYQRSTFKNIMRRTKYNPKLYQQIIYLLKKLNIIIFDYDKTKQLIKKRHITLPTKVRIVKAMVFPVVTYKCESWTVKKAEHQRTDAFELWC